MSGLTDAQSSVAGLASGLNSLNDDLQLQTDPTTGTDCEKKTIEYNTLNNLKTALDSFASSVLSAQTTLNAAVMQAEMDKNAACNPPP